MGENDTLPVRTQRVVESGARSPVSVNPGDVVLFGKYAGTEVTLDGAEHLILREDDILAVVE